MEMGTRGQSTGDPLQADSTGDLRGTGLGHSLPGCSHHNGQSVEERKIIEKSCLYIPQTNTHLKEEESSFFFKLF